MARGCVAVLSLHTATFTVYFTASQTPISPLKLRVALNSEGLFGLMPATQKHSNTQQTLPLLDSQGNFGSPAIYRRRSRTLCAIVGLEENPRLHAPRHMKAQRMCYFFLREVGTTEMS